MPAVAKPTVWWRPGSSSEQPGLIGGRRPEPHGGAAWCVAFSKGFWSRRAALVVARRDEMGRSWPDISLRNEKKTLVADAATPQGAQPVLGSRAIRPWSEMRPNRISTGSWVPATVTWALTSGDQLCPASAAGRNGAKSPTVAPRIFAGIPRGGAHGTGFERTSGCSLKTGLAAESS